MSESAATAGVTAPARPPFALLVGLTSASPFAMNAMLPALPAITAYFHTTYAVSQLALTVALLAFGAAQLVLGPLSDRFGRRPVMLWGFSLFVVGSLIAAMAMSPAMLILGRAVQAAGGAAGLVLGRTIVHDINGRGGAASAIGYLTMAMALSQMLAPWVGGTLEHSLGWRTIFWLLAAASIVLFWFTLRHLHETNDPGLAPPHTRSLAADALTLMRRPSFWALTGNLSFASGIFFAFAGNAPYVVQTLMGRTASEYGLYCILPALGYSLGNFLSGRYAGRIGQRAMILGGMGVAGAGIATFWLLYGWQHPTALFAPMTLVALSNGMTMPNAMVAAMNIDMRLSGAASGICGAAQMLTGAVLGFIVSLTMAASSLPMLVAMTVSFLLALACALVPLKE